jgi:hypothetical protein
MLVVAAGRVEPESVLPALTVGAAVAAAPLPSSLPPNAVTVGSSGATVKALISSVVDASAVIVEMMNVGVLVVFENREKFPVLLLKIKG